MQNVQHLIAALNAAHLNTRRGCKLIMCEVNLMWDGCIHMNVDIIHLLFSC